MIGIVNKGEKPSTKEGLKRSFDGGREAIKQFSLGRPRRNDLLCGDAVGSLRKNLLPKAQELAANPINGLWKKLKHSRSSWGNGAIDEGRTTQFVSRRWSAKTIPQLATGKQGSDGLLQSMERRTDGEKSKLPPISNRKQKAKEQKDHGEPGDLLCAERRKKKKRRPNLISGPQKRGNLLHRNGKSPVDRLNGKHMDQGRKKYSDR